VDIVDVYGLCLSEDDRAARIEIAADERAVGDRDIRGAKNNDSTNDVELRDRHVVRQYKDAVVDQFHVAGRLDMNPCPDAERKVLAINLYNFTQWLSCKVHTVGDSLDNVALLRRLHAGSTHGGSPEKIRPQNLLLSPSSLCAVDRLAATVSRQTGPERRIMEKSFRPGQETLHQTITGHEEIDISPVVIKIKSIIKSEVCVGL
jgi:hypothetical protein